MIGPVESDRTRPGSWRTLAGFLARLTVGAVVAWVVLPTLQHALEAQFGWSTIEAVAGAWLIFMVGLVLALALRKGLPRSSRPR